MLLVRKGRMLFQFSDTVKASGFRVYTIAEYEYGLYIKVVHACVEGLFPSLDFDHYRLYLQTIKIKLVNFFENKNEVSLQVGDFGY
jgi:hypothetical protein